MKIRVGFGFDVHQLVENHPFILGGVKLEHYSGAFGHSDADVLVHAICDALLGAANLRDIGYHFSNTDDRWKGISSLILLKESFELLKKEGWKVGNTDSVIILEEPKIYKHTDLMKKNISEIIETENISIKATTSEGIGFVGRKEGCAAYSTVLIYK